MVLTRSTSDSYIFEQPGFSVFVGKPTLQGHRHNEVEMVVFEHAPLTALYGGRHVVVPPDHLVVLWGAMSHQALEVPTETVGYGIRVPLGWILGWNLPETLTRRLTNLEVLIGRVQRVPCGDLVRMKDWIELIRGGRNENREIVLLEMQARLRRLAQEVRQGRRGKEPYGVGPSVNLGRFETMVRFISRNYLQAIQVPDVARAGGVSRTHAMRIFRRVTGMSVLDYLTQHRISNAQRLLATTDRKITAVAYDCGFNSQTRFFALFRKIVGMTPAKYRLSVWNR
ncbi:MAG: helix-turn-helix domain-containing protein [Phycisphaerae bacterium]|nr:helix-turn-helix domain-containing protein [Phycisphaerae bacterium]